MMVGVQTNHQKDTNLMNSINLELILTILYMQVDDGYPAKVSVLLWNKVGDRKSDSTQI